MREEYPLYPLKFLLFIMEAYDLFIQLKTLTNIKKLNVFMKTNGMDQIKDTEQTRKTLEETHKFVYTPPESLYSRQSIWTKLFETFDLEQMVNEFNLMQLQMLSTFAL